MLRYTSARGALEQWWELRPVDPVPATWRRRARHEHIQRVMRHRLDGDRLHRDLDAANDALAAFGVGARGPAPTPLHLVGGLCIEHALRQLTRFVERKHPSWCAMLEELDNQIGEARRQFPITDAELHCLVDRLSELQPTLAEAIGAAAAPLRLFIPTTRRRYDVDLDQLRHAGWQVADALPYKLNAFIDGSTDDPTATVHLSDVEVQGEEGFGLGSAVLSDLCHWADHANRVITGSFIPGRGSDDDQHRTERKTRMAAWYRRHGFQIDDIERLVRQPRALDP